MPPLLHPVSTNSAFIATPQSQPGDTTLSDIVITSVPVSTNLVSITVPNIQSGTASLSESATASASVGASSDLLANSRLTQSLDVTSSQASVVATPWTPTSIGVSPSNSPVSAGPSIVTPTADVAPVETHLVNVGTRGKLIFEPQPVDAAVGDLIVFQFLTLNHTVTQSSFENPCVSQDGFDSGFRFFNPTNQTGVINQRLTFLVRESDPMWFFCRQTVPRSHCNSGMVFAVNAGDLWTEFQSNAEGSNRTIASSADSNVTAGDQNSSSTPTTASQGSSATSRPWTSGSSSIATPGQGSRGSLGTGFLSANAAVSTPTAVSSANVRSVYFFTLIILVVVSNVIRELF